MGSSKPVATSLVSTPLIVVAFLAGPWLLPEVNKPTSDAVPDEVVLKVTPVIPDALVGRQLERLDPQERSTPKTSCKDDSYNEEIAESKELEVDAMDSVPNQDNFLFGMVSLFMLIGLVVARNDIIEMAEDMSDDMDKDRYFTCLIIAILWVGGVISLTMTVIASFNMFSETTFYFRPLSFWDPIFVAFQESCSPWSWHVFDGGFSSLSDHFLVGISSLFALLGVIVARNDIFEMIEHMSDGVDGDGDGNFACFIFVLLCGVSAMALAMTLTTSYDIDSMMASNSMACWDLALVAVWENYGFWNQQMLDALTIVALLISSILGRWVANIDFFEMSKEETKESCAPFHILSQESL